MFNVLQERGNRNAACQTARSLDDAQLRGTTWKLGTGHQDETLVSSRICYSLGSFTAFSLRLLIIDKVEMIDFQFGCWSPRII